jgi:hypothetical protein
LEQLRLQREELEAEKLANAQVEFKIFYEKKKIRLFRNILACWTISI